MDSYAVIAILAMALGLALLVAEVFIPSGGLIMTAATVTFIVSVWAAWQAWYKTDQYTTFIAYIVALLVLFPTVLSGAFYVFPRTEYGKRLMSPPSREEMEPYVEETEHLRSLVGKSGTALTRLAPGGLILVNGERLHAESEGMLIPADAPIRVLAMKGNRLLVRQVREDVPQESSDGDESQASDERTPLDDEFSQS